MALPPHTESRPQPVSHRDSLQELCLAGGYAATSSRGVGWFPDRKGLRLSFQKFAGIFQSIKDSQKPAHWEF